MQIVDDRIAADGVQFLVVNNLGIDQKTRRLTGGVSPFFSGTMGATLTTIIRPL